MSSRSLITSAREPPGKPVTMTAPESPSLEQILRLCAESAPRPWYPSAYARDRGVSRDSLDGPLDRLRLAGLVELTD